MRAAKQADRHLPTMTVQETFKFAFDSMGGGSHMTDIWGSDYDVLSPDQKDLVDWMDQKNLKVIKNRIR